MMSVDLLMSFLHRRGAFPDGAMNNHRHLPVGTFAAVLIHGFFDDLAGIRLRAAVTAYRYSSDQADDSKHYDALIYSGVPVFLVVRQRLFHSLGMSVNIFATLGRAAFYPGGKSSADHEVQVGQCHIVAH